MNKKVLALFLIFLAVCPVWSDRFYPEKADRYAMTIRGEERMFYSFQYKAFTFVGTSEIQDLDIKYFKRNPYICLSVKIKVVLEDSFEIFGSKEKIYLDLENEEYLLKYTKGDNIWCFAKLDFVGKTDIFDVVAIEVYDLESDEEKFYQWRNKISLNDAGALIQLGLKALEEGKSNGNLEIWSRLARDVILRGVEIKRTKLTKPKEFITLSKQVMELLNDKDFALQVVVAEWKKDKENTELNYYLKHILKYSLYKGEWLPVRERYGKEFEDRFNAVKYNEDNKMWELKRWVELNRNKLPSPEEQIMQCAQRTYAMNPSHEAAAAYIGKEPREVGDFESSGKIVVPRIPLIITEGDQKIEFDIDNSWNEDTDIPETAKAKYVSSSDDDTYIIIKYIDWGKNLEEVNKKFLASIKDKNEFKLETNEVITIRDKEFYHAVYTWKENARIIKNEATLIKLDKPDVPGYAIIFQSPGDIFDSFAEEFSKIRSSLNLQ